jgi:endonuclease/exonuclease/phosphatase (EEP) superfamily protein YafD
MSYARKNAIIATIIWSLILAGLIIVVLGPGVNRFTDPERSIWRVITAVIILPGFLLNVWLGWSSKRGKKLGELDERDEAVARRASEATLVVVAALIYLTSIILYETHIDSGAVPTGWLYLIAYGTIALVSLVHAIATLVIDSGGMSDG